MYLLTLLQHLHTVNIEELNCPVENENSSSSVDSSATEDQVCGDDGRTYSSLCHLLQTSSGVSVAHPGPCDDPECQGGEVSKCILLVII